MKRFTFGTPESAVPSTFCRNFRYEETNIAYPADRIHFRISARGCELFLPLAENEQIYGMGLQLKAFNLRGKKMTLRVNADPVAPTGDSHAPVPFFVSTAGYGVYVDTARQAEFDFGSSQRLGASVSHSDRAIAVSTDELYAHREEGASHIGIHIPHVQGVTIYILEGDTITDIVSQYNRLSGGGCAVPEWGLSPMYRCYSRYTQNQVLALAKTFRQEEYAVGIIGLEPGWQTHTYSCSYLWDTDRFPTPRNLLNELKQMDYHVNLWEHAFVHPSSPIFADIAPYSGDYSVWEGAVPDFSLSRARQIFADHHKQIVRTGVDGFKLDECDGSDYTGSWSFPNHSQFPSGLDGEQYHALFGTLYMQTMLEALSGQPTLSQVRNAGALAASYPFVLYSDLYDHPDFIRGCATAGFSGLLWSPEVRHANSAEEFIRRLQCNVFSVQCLINAWYCEDMPWLAHGCAEQVKELLSLRMRIIPMLQAAFDRYHKTGIPPVRALVCDYTDDPETWNLDNEYIFCDSLLVAPIPAGQTGRNVYLPQGQWRNFFTHEVVPAGHFTVETDGIPVYEKQPDR